MAQEYQVEWIGGGAGAKSAARAIRNDTEICGEDGTAATPIVNSFRASSLRSLLLFPPR